MKESLFISVGASFAVGWSVVLRFVPEMAENAASKSATFLIFKCGLDSQIRRHIFWRLSAIIVVYLLVIDTMEPVDVSIRWRLLITPIKWIVSLSFKMFWLSMAVNEGATIVFDGCPQFDVLICHLVLHAWSYAMAVYCIVGCSVYIVVMILASFSFLRLLACIGLALGLLHMFDRYWFWLLGVAIYSSPVIFRIRPRSPPPHPFAPQFVQVLVWRRTDLCEIHNPAQPLQHLPDAEVMDFFYADHWNDGWPRMDERLPPWIAQKLSERVAPAG